MDLRVSSPCPKKWEDLVGDDRRRYCADCNLNVYNLAEMAPAEVDALVRRSNGRLCGRLYLRGDRTATLRDCPSYARQQMLRRIGAAAAVVLLVALGIFFRSQPGPDRSGFPGWARDFLNMIDPEPVTNTSITVVGKICPPPPPSPPAQPGN